MQHKSLQGMVWTVQLYTRMQKIWDGLAIIYHSDTNNSL